MAKLILDTPISGGDLLPEINEARVFNVRIDFERSRVEALVSYGREVSNRFVQSPVVPPNAGQVIVDLEQYADVNAAWNNFQRALLRRGSTEGILPPGQDSD